MKKTNFKTDIQIERKFSRYLKAILGNQFIIQDRIEDIENGTDFLLLKMTPFKVGVRLRRYYYYEYKNGIYRNEFTIRWDRPSGVKTEIDKIRDGLVDYILYGFIDKNEKIIIQYFIGDLEVFRNNEPEPIGIRQNNPPDSRLAIYNVNQFKEDFIIKKWVGNGY